MLTSTVSGAAADTQQFHCKGGASFTDGIETNIDTNGDGVSATVDQGAEVCTNGNAVFQEEFEWIQRPAVTSACPAGTTLELYIDATHGQHRAVTTDEDTGDQTFAQYTSGTLCINYSTFTLTGHAEGIIIGGTGKNNGATGTRTSRFSGSYLQAGFKNGVFGGLGQSTFTSDGTLILPDRRHDRGEGKGGDHKDN
jgi:hypothetical protein